MAAANSGRYAQSEEKTAKRQKVCAKYETRSGWSDGYTVTAVMTDGATLNEETGSYNYDSYANYAVIFWDEDEASVLKIQSVSGGVSSVGTRATDQEGRTWKLST
jgi:hypothetical protein